MVTQYCFNNHATCDSFLYGMELSVVITLLNEEQNVEPLLDQLYQALPAYDHEIILVDDGSTDRTVERVKQFARSNVKLVILNTNYGQTAAMAAGIQEASGRYIATMDGDLQNDPTDIPFMLEKLKNENWDVVAGAGPGRTDPGRDRSRRACCRRRQTIGSAPRPASGSSQPPGTASFRSSRGQA